MKFIVTYILKGFKPFGERPNRYHWKKVECNYINLKVWTAIRFLYDSYMLFGYYWNYLKLSTRSCRNLLCRQSSALLVPIHLNKTKMSAKIIKALILTEWRVCSLHIQHYTRGDTSVHLLYMMTYITKTPYLWTSNDVQMVYKFFGTEGFIDILWEIYCTESITDK